MIVSVVVVVVLSSGLAQCQFVRPGPPDFCPNDLYHKDAPSSETETLLQCGSWQSNSCCTPETARSINESMDLGLYNFSWTLCGSLSDECLSFLENEACFYECEPMLGYFLSGQLVKDVPVCGSYCDKWFNACRDDFTCVTNWQANYLQALSEGMNTCPTGSDCNTFEQLFGSSKNFCNTLWGDSYIYTENEDNCTVMTFDPDMPNPNYQLSFPGDKGRMAQASAFIMLVITIALYFVV